VRKISQGRSDNGETNSGFVELATDREVRTAIDQIRERGIAFERGEQHPDLRSVAVSVDVDAARAAVYVVAPADRMRGKRFEENIPGLVSNTAKKIATAVSSVRET